MPGVNVYFIDVGVLSPTNVALTELSLSEQTVASGSALEIRAAVTATGVDPGDRLVELSYENAAGKLVKYGQQTVRIDPASAATAAFSFRVPARPLLPGAIPLLSSAPL